MYLQHLADHSSNQRLFATLRPQPFGGAAFRCDLTSIPAILGANGRSTLHKLRLRLDRAIGSGSLVNIFRRQQCPRASSLSRWQACLRWLPPVAAAKKSSLWLSPSPSRSSPHTPANTSNDKRGPALWPAPAVPRGAGLEALLC
jgi:hypothetical protein